MKIMLSGGGSLGPVTPLLGLVEYWRRHNVAPDLVWVGTVKGPEASVVSAQGIRFVSIASVKLPRHPTPYWLAVPFLGFYALIESWNLLRHERPDVIVTAGGYVSVPLIVLGRLMGIRSWVHQQDLLPGLANKIAARFATKVSVTFEDSKSVFSARKTVVTGNALRASMLEGSREQAMNMFGLDPNRKTLLVVGGGGGAAWINQSVSAIAEHLTKQWQVLHVTGRDRGNGVRAQDHYVVEPLINDGMAHAFAAADVVLCRAGLGTLTELAAVGKPAIVVPMPDTHQELNAFYLYEHQAALILDQTETTPQILLSAIRTVMESEDIRLRFTANLKLSFPKDGTKAIADGVLALARESDAKWSRKPASSPPGEDVGAGHAPPVSVDPADDLPLSIQEQVARALSGESVEFEEGGDDESPFEVKDV